MADKRAYAKFDVGYMDNPKLVALLDALPHAVLMHCKSVLYASQHLTDGHVPPGVVRRHVGGSQEDVEALVERGLWHRHGHDCPECPQPSDLEVYVHDYLQHNRSKDDYNRLAKRGKKAAQARWSDATSTAPSNATSIQDGMQNPMPRREEKREDNKHSSDTEEDFESWYQAYPRKVGKGQARKAFRAALKKTTLDTLNAGLEKYRHQLQRDRTEQRHIAHPATWLNGERWADDYGTPPTPPAGPPPPGTPDHRTVFDMTEEEFEERQRAHRERIQARRNTAA